MYKNLPKTSKEISDQADKASAKAFASSGIITKALAGEHKAGSGVPSLHYSVAEVSEARFADKQKSESGSAAPALNPGAGAAELFGAENIQKIKAQESSMSSRFDKDLRASAGKSVGNIVTGEVTVVRAVDTPEFDESGFMETPDGAKQHIAGHITAE